MGWVHFISLSVHSSEGGQVSFTLSDKLVSIEQSVCNFSVIFFYSARFFRAKTDLHVSPFSLKCWNFWKLLPRYFKIPSSWNRWRQNVCPLLSCVCSEMRILANSFHWYIHTCSFILFIQLFWSFGILFGTNTSSVFTQKLFERMSRNVLIWNLGWLLYKRSVCN